MPTFMGLLKGFDHIMSIPKKKSDTRKKEKKKEKRPFALLG